MPAVLAILFSADVPGADARDIIRTASPADRKLTENDFPRMQRIASNVYTYEALTGPPDDRYTTNSLFVVSDDGILVADGQGDPQETARLVQAIGTISSAPIRYVVICSDHRDHTGGNEAFPAEAIVIAQRHSLPALQRTLAHEDLMPELVVDDRLSINLGGETIDIRFFGRAHTGGDLFVHLPRQGVLFATETFLNHMFSGFRSAYTREWIAALDEAEALGADFLVPGHGFVDSAEVLREEWTEHKRHVEFIFDEVSKLHTAGLSVDEAIERIDYGPYAGWSGAASQGPIAVRRIYAELNGELP